MKIKVVVCRVDQEPVVEEIDRDLESMQKIVGGYIEQIRAMMPDIQGGRSNRLVIICNEEGRLKKLKPNRFGLLGDFFVCGAAGSDGEYQSVPESEIQRLLHLLKWAAGG